MKLSNKTKATLETLLVIGLNGFIVLLILALVLTACSSNQASQTPTATQAVLAPFPTETYTSLPATVSPSLTFQVAITANPEQLAKWQEYERALASRLLFLHPLEEILCEWEILGQSGLEVYVWAVCLGLPPKGRSELYAPIASVPAVIHLGLDGSVQSVELPRDGGRDYGEGIRDIFPVDVRERISKRSIGIVAMADHAKLRRKNPGPPLIVLLATPQP
ncbi:MAG: hypothetical protein IPG44_04915 [Anaerolineales bacterium]|nr:hypothetical protein [Anaerolineales bacterium]